MFQIYFYRQLLSSIFFLSVNYIPATISQVNNPDMIANLRNDKWITIKYNPKLSNKFNYGDSILVKATPIFNFYKAYCRKSERKKEYSNVGVNVLLPIFLIIINIFNFVIFIIFPSSLDFKDQRFDSFYDSFISPNSISRIGIHFFLIPLILNLYYWYHLFQYIFS